METVSGNEEFALLADEVAEQTETAEQPTFEVIDYTEQFNILNENINCGFMFTVFFIGVITGVLIGKILWSRVHI